MKETPYDFFLMNLKMMEAMVTKMKVDGSTNDTVPLQIAMLKEIVESLNKLSNDLSTLATKDVRN